MLNTFARLRQRTTGMNTRISYTATPNLSLQVYAQPYISKGRFSDLRELDDPRASAYDDRFKPYADPAVAADPGGFTFKQFRSNSVLRWEYRPGSTIFLVWAQGRQDYLNEFGQGNVRDDYRELFRLHPDNTFLVKMSYWFSR